MYIPTSHIWSVGTHKPGTFVSPLGPHLSPKGLICYIHSDPNTPHCVQGTALGFSMGLGISAVRNLSPRFEP